MNDGMDCCNLGRVRCAGNVEIMATAGGYRHQGRILRPQKSFLDVLRLYSELLYTLHCLFGWSFFNNRPQLCTVIKPAVAAMAKEDERAINLLLSFTGIFACNYHAWLRLLEMSHGKTPVETRLRGWQALLEAISAPLRMK